ncbi:MAG: O-antigen ligase family protein [Chloroflexi bacterium]|nr:O-antigen ligase family protein [Chloroflexota bacterium]
MTRIVVWAVLLLSALFLLTTGGTYPGIASVEAHIIGQVIAYVVLGGWCLLALFRPEWRPDTPLLLPIALATGAYLLSFAFSQRPRLSLEPTLAGLGWAAGFLFLSQLLKRDWWRMRIQVVLTAAAAAVSLAYVVQVTALWIEWWGIIGRLALPPLRPAFAGLWLGSPNLVATFLLLTTPLAVVLLHRDGRRWLAIALALTSLLAVFLTGSRGAWLGAGFGVLGAAVLTIDRIGWIRLREGAIATISQCVHRARLMAAGFVLLALAAVVILPSLAYRFGQGGDTLRLDLWRSALTIFVEHPVLGGGPGTWVQLKVAASPPGVPNVIVPHAHSMYFQTAAELGVVGVVALSGLGVAVAVRLLQGWRLRDGEISLQAGAVIVSGLAFLGQSLVDNLVNLPFVCLILVTVIAWTDHARSPLTSNVRRFRWRARSALPAGILAGLVASAIVLVPVGRAAFKDLAANGAMLRLDWSSAVAHYVGALASDPDFTLYQLQLASALARNGQSSDARIQLENAVRDDQMPINVIGLAMLKAMSGDPDSAVRDAREAAARAVGVPMIALNAGIVAELAGDQTMAVDQFANAIAWNPPLASSPWWNGRTRYEVFPAILDLARSRVSPLDGALILAYSGQSAAAADALAAAAGSSPPVVYASAVRWLAGDRDGALKLLEDELRAHPDNWLAAAWAARIARLSGDPDTGERYARWASLIQGDGAPAVIAEASIIAAPNDPNAGLVSNYPWAQYLRPNSPFLPVPDLMLISTR